MADAFGDAVKQMAIQDAAMLRRGLCGVCGTKLILKPVVHLLLYSPCPTCGRVWSEYERCGGGLSPRDDDSSLETEESNAVQTGTVR